MEIFGFSPINSMRFGVSGSFGSCVNGLSRLFVVWAIRTEPKV